MPKTFPFRPTTNEDRIESAAQIVGAYGSRVVAGHDVDDADAITDILADLRHYAASKGIDFDACAERAELHFTEEVN